MIIKAGEQEFELKTNLGTAKLIEGEFKQPLTVLFDRLEDATIEETLTLLAYGCGGRRTTEGKALVDALEEHSDYIELKLYVADLIVNLMFSGTDEQKEAKIAKAPFSEAQKNAIREQLGLPISEAPNMSTQET